MYPNTIIVSMRTAFNLDRAATLCMTLSLLLLYKKIEIFVYNEIITISGTKKEKVRYTVVDRRPTAFLEISQIFFSEQSWQSKLWASGVLLI